MHGFVPSNPEAVAGAQASVTTTVPVVPTSQKVKTVDDRYHFMEGVQHPSLLGGKMHRR